MRMSKFGNRESGIQSGWGLDGNRVQRFLLLILTNR